MKALLKNAREAKGFTTREVGRLLKIDQALICKFESGQRRPTKKQIVQLSELLEIDLETITVLWLKEKILHEVSGEALAIEALNQAIATLGNETQPSQIDELFEEMEALRLKMESLRSTQKL